MKSEHSEELLKFACHDQRVELEYRRNREHQIFGWTASILLAIIAALFIKSPATEKLFQTQNIFWRLLISAIIAGLTIYSISWQHYHNTKASEHKRVLASLWDKLKFFDGDSQILLSKWKDWGKKNLSIIDQLRFRSRISATAFLGIVGLMAIWIDLIFNMN